MASIKFVANHFTTAYQPCFFDVDNRTEKMKEYNSPQLRLAEYIDFNFFRGELDKYFLQGKDYSKGGRPPYDYILVFKILVICRLSLRHAIVVNLGSLQSRMPVCLPGRQALLCSNGPKLETVV
jgi:hypothetical protein